MAHWLRGFAPFIALPSILFTIVSAVILSGVGALLARPFATQRRYLARAIFWHAGHLLRGHWLCPECLGSGHVGVLPGEPGHLACQFCLHLLERDHGVPVGYVRFHRLMHDWDKRHWRQRVPAWVIPQSAKS